MDEKIKDELSGSSDEEAAAGDDKREFTMEEWMARVAKHPATHINADVAEIISEERERRIKEIDDAVKRNWKSKS